MSDYAFAQTDATAEEIVRFRTAEREIAKEMEHYKDRPMDEQMDHAYTLLLTKLTEVFGEERATVLAGSRPVVTMVQGSGPESPR